MWKRSIKKFQKKLISWLQQSNILAHLLFVNMRAHMNIETAAVFLSTRLKSPDEDDWGKLKRVIKYLNATKN